MLKQVIADAILRHNLQHKKFVIAFSGGIDSTALCYLFYQLAQANILEQPPFVRAVYVNHNLSPNAKLWQQHCHDFCLKLNLKFEAISVTIDGNNNLESKARQARYQAFKANLNVDEVLVCAHHQQDLVETFLLNLKRGAGIDGLSAMPELSFQHGFALLRPLLQQTKHQLEQLLQQHNLPYIYDESNENDNFDRNFLRNQILPLLNQRWHGFNNNVARCAENLSQAKQLLNATLQPNNANLMAENRLDLTNLNAKTESEINFILRNFIAQQQSQMPSTKVLQQIKQQFLTNPSPLAQIDLATGSLKIYQNKLYFCRKEELNPELIDPNLSFKLNVGETLLLPLNLGSLTLHNLDSTSYQLTWTTATQCKKYSVMSNAVTVKFNQNDKFIFNGMRRELKKIYQAQQIPSWQRHNHPQIYINDQPVLLLI